MATQNGQINSEVTAFLDGLNHPLRKEIEALRINILMAVSELAETIKWNGPNYSYQGNDRITMKIQPPKQIQLIFHRGAKVQEQPKRRLIDDSGNTLVWKENDRAIVTFRTMEDIENKKAIIDDVIKKWIEAAG